MKQFLFSKNYSVITAAMFVALGSHAGQGDYIGAGFMFGLVCIADIISNRLQSANSN